MSSPFFACSDSEILNKGAFAILHSCGKIQGKLALHMVDWMFHESRRCESFISIYWNFPKVSTMKFSVAILPFAPPLSSPYPPPSHSPDIPLPRVGKCSFENGFCCFLGTKLVFFEKVFTMMVWEDFWKFAFFEFFLGWCKTIFLKFPLTKQIKIAHKFDTKISLLIFFKLVLFLGTLTNPHPSPNPLYVSEYSCQCSFWLLFCFLLVLGGGDNSVRPPLPSPLPPLWPLSPPCYQGGFSPQVFLNKKNQVTLRFLWISYFFPKKIKNSFWF